MYDVKNVSDCTGYGSPSDGNNPLIEEARKALKAATEKISCKDNCKKDVTEVFCGWKCEKDSSGNFFQAQVLVQWKVECKR